MLQNRLHKLRKEKGLKMKEVAEAIGIDATTYSKYENGARLPRYAILLDLANFYDVTVDYLTGANSNKNVATTELLENTYSFIEENFGEDVQIMFSDITTFDQEEKEQLKMFIDLIKKSKK